MKFVVTQAILAAAILTVVLLMSGCSVKGVNATMFLKEDGSRLYNLQGKDCLESGYQIIKMQDGENYRLTYYYSNCDVHRDRELKEFELKDWAIKPKGSVGIQ